MPRMQREDGRPIDLRYETKRQSLDRPAYGAHLPKCFPFRIKLSPRAAADLSEYLMDQGITEEPWHAITGHPVTADQWVYLWLSKPAASAMVQHELISEDSLEETLSGR